MLVMGRGYVLSKLFLNCLPLFNAFVPVANSLEASLALAFDRIFQRANTIVSDMMIMIRVNLVKYLLN